MGLSWFCTLQAPVNNIHLVTVTLHLTGWLIVNITQITRARPSSSKTDFNEIAAISTCPVPSWTLKQNCFPFQLFPENAASTLLRDLDSSLTSLPTENSALYRHKEGKQALPNRRQKHYERCGRSKLPWTVPRLMLTGKKQPLKIIKPTQPIIFLSFLGTFHPIIHENLRATFPSHRIYLQVCVYVTPS